MGTLQFILCVKAMVRTVSLPGHAVRLTVPMRRSKVSMPTARVSEQLETGLIVGTITTNIRDRHSAEAGIIDASTSKIPEGKETGDV